MMTVRDIDAGMLGLCSTILERIKLRANVNDTQLIPLKLILEVIPLNLCSTLNKKETLALDIEKSHEINYSGEKCVYVQYQVHRQCGPVDKRETQWHR